MGDVFFDRPRRRVPVAGVASPLHRTALAHAAAGAPALLPLLRAVGLLEAAVALDTLNSSLDVDAIQRQDARVGTELLLDVVADGLLVVPDHRAALELAALLRRVRRQLDDQPLAAARLLALAHDLDGGDHVADLRPRPGAAGARPAASAAPPRAGRGDTDRLDRHRPAVPLAAAASRRRMDPHSLTRLSDVRRVTIDAGCLAGALAEAELFARRRAPSEIEVRVNGWSDRCAGLWARAFHAPDDCLVAVAPFLSVGGNAVARLLVPPGTAERLEVDLTDRPEMPRPSPSLAAAQLAIHAGRMASQAERLGRLGDAAAWWRTCAQHWDVAGDADRARQARTYAGAARPRDFDRAGRTIAPLVSDLVGDS
jgi:hypothetical protein